jgi:hypothetical protein
MIWRMLCCAQVNASHDYRGGIFGEKCLGDPAVEIILDLIR